MRIMRCEPAAPREKAAAGVEVSGGSPSTKPQSAFLMRSRPKDFGQSRWPSMVDSGLAKADLCVIAASERPVIPIKKESLVFGLDRLAYANWPWHRSCVLHAAGNIMGSAGERPTSPSDHIPLERCYTSLGLIRTSCASLSFFVAHTFALHIRGDPR
jgi:hypothetical protein